MKSPAAINREQSESRGSTAVRQVDETGTREPPYPCGPAKSAVNTCRSEHVPQGLRGPRAPTTTLAPPTQWRHGARQIRSAMDVAGLVFHNTMRLSRAEEEQGTANTDLRWKGSAGAHQHPRDHARAGPGPRLEEGGRRMQNSTEGKTNRFRARNAARGRMS